MPADRAPPEPSTPEPRAVRRAFGRAAGSYDAAAALQREVSRRLAERLDVVKLVPSVALDAGCGTGEALGELAAAVVIAVAGSLAAVLLGAPQRQIGARAPGRRILVQPRPGQTDGQRRRVAPAAALRQFTHAAQEALERGFRLFLRHVCQQHRELLRARPSHCP